MNVNINLDINDIDLTVDDYKVLQPLLIKYHETKETYKSKKKELYYLNKKDDTKHEDKSILGFLFNDKKNVNTNYEEQYLLKVDLEKTVNALKRKKDDIFFEINKMIKKMISSNPKYNDFYVTYLDYSSYNNEILENYKSHMDLVKYKKTLDKFFYKLKNDMEENNTLNDDEIAKYKKKYKNIVDFLQTVYFAEKGGKKINEDNSNITFEFSSELSLDDAYTVLSIISLIYSTIINPIYNNYKDMYIQFANRKRFINQYNKRLLQITYQALNLSYKDKLDYNDNDDLEEFVD